MANCHWPSLESLPWSWTHDIDKTFGSGCHNYCPTAHYAKMHLQAKLHHWPLLHKINDVEMDNHKFLVRVEVEHFSPDEILVHFTGNNHLVIEGKHEEKLEDDDGFVSRQFRRRYEVPKDIEEDDMVCNLSSDGILTVSVPRHPPKMDGAKRIPITQTNQPAIPTSPLTKTAIPG